MLLGRWAIALLASVAVVVSSPWLGDLRQWLRTSFPQQFLPALNLVLGLVALATIGIALGRIRTHRIWRFGALVAAAIVAVVWAIANRHMSVETNAVERFHFAEYGALTWLFYRAALSGTAHRADIGALAVPVLAGLIVGTADEALQWFVPIRVGEVRDIFLNLTAIGTGLLVSLALQPPGRLHRFSPRSARLTGVLAAAAIVAVTAFVDVVHVGVRITDSDIGTFVSRYDGPGLLALAADRERRWREAPPPLVAARMSQEDQYLFEANKHVQARNGAWEHDPIVAWGENRILETFFAPSLATPSFAVPAGSRWPDVQRNEADRRRQAEPARPFESHALPEGYILESPSAPLWASGLGLAALLAAGFFLVGKRSN